MGSQIIEKHRKSWADAGFTIEDAGEFNRAAVKIVDGVAFYVSNLDGDDVASPQGECQVLAFDPDTFQYLDVGVQLTGLDAVDQALPELARRALEVTEARLPERPARPRMG